jgi:hypothetical protein
MSNPPYIAAARQRASVRRRRALAAQLTAEAEANLPARRSKRTTKAPDGPKANNPQEA